jgi:hypothetical protein
MLLSKDPRYILLMSGLSLLLSGLLLHLPAFELLLSAEFGSLESLGLDQLGIPDLFIFLLLILHNSQLFILQDKHASLFKGLPHEDIEHGLDLGIEVEEIRVLIVDLGVLAVFLEGHTWLEERDWGTVQIEFCCDTFFSLRWLISKKLHILFCLYIHMKTPWNGLWCRDVTVRIDGARSFWGTSKLKWVKDDRYLPWLFF